MDKIIDVTGGKGGNAFLIVGADKTALIDCGMAYCAPKLISNIKQALQERTLDYILISHSHYDHVGAIPYLKKAWPNSRVLGAEYAKRILQRTNALQAIRSLSIEAATLYAGNAIAEYDDQMMKVDTAISDGEIVDLGGSCIKVIETQGHTKCSLSFLVDNETLFPSESTGFMSNTGELYPAFITSCTQALNSINICKKLKPRFIISPHLGLVSEQATIYYWEKCLLAVKETKHFILGLAAQGYDEEQILAEYEAIFRDEYHRSEQPLAAFRLNAQGMIKTVLRES